jgi:hypothetical protein
MLRIVFIIGLALASVAPGAFAQGTAVAVRLSWQAPAVPWAANVGIRVYRQAACAGAFTLVGTVPSATVRSFDDGTAVRGARYCWRVTAFDPVQESDPSNVADFTVPATLEVPRGVTINLVITVPLSP